jgi:hypothetical protein
MPLPDGLAAHNHRAEEPTKPRRPATSPYQSEPVRRNYENRSPTTIFG